MESFEMDELPVPQSLSDNPPQLWTLQSGQINLLDPYRFHLVLIQAEH